jgi:hypothetical protein
MAGKAVRATVERTGKVPRYNTAGVREHSEWSCGSSDIEGKTTRVGASECGQRTSFNRTRVAGSRDEVEGVVVITLNLFCSGAVGFIDWLDAAWSRAFMKSRAVVVRDGGRVIASAWLRRTRPLFDEKSQCCRS